MPIEARIREDGIHVSEWARWVFGLILSGLVAMNAYAYYVIFPSIVNAIVANEKETRNREMIISQELNAVELKVVEIARIKEDIAEIKAILKEDQNCTSVQYVPVGNRGYINR